MKTLLTFAGLRDPYYHDLFEDGQHRGPILTVLAEKLFDRVVLFSRPYRSQNVEKTTIAISLEQPRTRVEVVEVDIKDATFYPEILAKLRPALANLRRLNPEDEYFISASSGTPEIHACWALIVACGEFPARILNFKRTAQSGLARKSIMREVVLDNAGNGINPEMLARLSARPGGITPEEILRESGILGRHPLLHHAIETALLISQYDGPVLIEGEPGTGKKLFASLMHRLGTRSARPCLYVNCAALPPDIAVGVLFGERTPAGELLAGKLEAADGGTLVFENISELPREAQARLANFLDEGAIFQPGAFTPLRLNVRIMATSPRRLAEDAAAGRFREDLARKFTAERLRLPPLRERRGDVTLLVQAELKKLNETLPRPRRLSSAALARLEAHSWPGNLAELRHVLSQAVLTAPNNLIEPEDLDLEQVIDLTHDTPASPVRLTPGFSIEAHLGGVRKALIEAALRKTNGNRTQAARLLGITPQAVSKYVKDHER